MKSLHQLLLISLVAVTPLSAYSATPLDSLLNEYRQESRTDFNAESGKTFWQQTHQAQETPQTRSCSSCHTDNLRATGKHVKTRKPIDPIAPSANPQRFTDLKKIRKWLKRNCLWILGRECTAQEKGDVLTYLKTL